MTTARAELIFASAKFDQTLANHLRDLSAPTRRRPEELRPMYMGTCSRWDRHRRFGFIAADYKIDGIDESREVYIHRSRLPAGVGHLTPHARVEFVLEEPHVKGRAMEARVVRVMDEAKEAA